MLTEEDLTRVNLIAGLYPEEGGWISDADVQGLAAFGGFIREDDVYLQAYDRRLAIECLRVVLGRGIPEPRAGSLRQRIIELLRGGGVPPAPGDGGGEGTDGVDETARARAAAALDRANDAFTAAGLAHNRANIAAATANAAETMAAADEHAEGR